MLLPTPILGGAYEGVSSDANPQECVNLYLCQDQEGGHSALVGLPGLKQVGSSGVVATTKEFRGLYVMAGTLYGVCAQRLSAFDTDFSETTIGNLITNSGPVTMADNGSYLFICDGTYGYVYNSSDASFVRLTEATHGFLGGGSATFQDGHFPTHEPGTRDFRIQETTNNPLVWRVIDLTSVQAKPGNLVRVYSDKRNLWAFKEDNIEIFENTGDLKLTFRRVNGGNIESTGLVAAASLASLADTIIWLGNRSRIFVADGYRAKVVSRPQVSYNISAYGVRSDAVGFAYDDEGRSFYQISFPTAGETWICEVSTGNWSKRTSYKGVDAQGRHRANCYASFDNKHIVGDYENGKLYELSSSIYEDDGHAILKKRTWAATNDGLARFYGSLRLQIEAGVGLKTKGDGFDPQAMLRWSDDGGHTYSNEHWVSMGKTGEYNVSPIWRRLGRSREGNDRVFELSISSAVKTVIKAAIADVDIAA